MNLNNHSNIRCRDSDLKFLNLSTSPTVIEVPDFNVAVPTESPGFYSIQPGDLSESANISNIAAMSDSSL